MSETYKSLLEAFNWTSDQNLSLIEDIDNAESRYIKDLKINVSNFLNNPQHLSKKEAALIAFSVAVNDKQPILSEALRQKALNEGANEAEIAEIIACVSLLNVNNVFYRFRHFTEIDYYQNTPAGIKMTLMGNPVLGKLFFELVSLCVSALNGCEMCVRSHEQSVIAHGATQAQVYEAIRLTAVIRGLAVLAK